MSKPKITLYLDLISPFAYIAYYITRTTPSFQKCEITYIPILIGAIMTATGNKSPIFIKNKAEFISRDRARWSSYFQVPILDSLPQPFPQPTLNAQRALCHISSSDSSQEKLIAAFDALYHAFWVEGKRIGDLEVISSTLKNAGGFGDQEVEEIVKAVGTEEVKSSLKRNTERAVEEGAFGLPWFVATNEKGETEGFWGVDHVGQLMDFLGLERGEGWKFRAVL